MGKRKPLSKLIFNAGQYVIALSLTAGGAVAVRHPPLAGAPRGHLGAPAAVLALCWGVYFVVNLALVAVAISLCEGTSWWDEFVDDIGYYAVTMFAVLALSPLVVIVTSVSWRLVPLLLLPLFLVYKTASISLEKEHAALARRPHRAGQPQAAARPDALAADEASQRSGHQMALCLLDLDRFKEVNDTLGHHTGDRLLEIVASRLLRAVRPEDMVARLGGDEFAVLLTDVDDPRRPSRLRSASGPCSPSRCTWTA